MPLLFFLLLWNIFSSLTFLSLLPGSVEVILEHDAHLSLVGQVPDEGVSQQGVCGGSMQMVLDQAAIGKGQEALGPAGRQRGGQGRKAKGRRCWKVVKKNTMLNVL